LKPNIVYILADDMGFDDMGFGDMGFGDMGFNNPESKIPTPHLDQKLTE